MLYEQYSTKVPCVAQQLATCSATFQFLMHTVATYSDGVIDSHVKGSSRSFNYIKKQLFLRNIHSFAKNYITIRRMIQFTIIVNISYIFSISPQLKLHLNSIQ